MEATLILNRIEHLHKQLQKDRLRSYDPYDGLSSPIARFFTLNNHLLSRVFQQAVLHCPVNLRPLLGIKKIEHTKAISDLVSAFAYLYAATNKEIYRQQSLSLLEKLESIAVVSEKGKAWGLRFPFATRFVKAKAADPNIFQTINAVNAYLDVYEFVDSTISITPVFKAINYIKTVFGFVENDSSILWKYWQGLEVEIFNVNGLMIGVLSRLYRVTGKEEYLGSVRKTYNYLMQRQNPDGSWYYAHGEKAKFIDGFHTGYILEGIARAVLNDCISIDQQFKKAVAFYREHHFTPDAVPKYFHNNVKPYDIQNAAQAIQTLLFLHQLNLVSLDFITRVAQRVDALFWNNKGYYDFSSRKPVCYRVPMHRWATGPILLALSILLLELSKK